jgi:ABC-type Fe3+/spermidine/putrescine transport system ATPase subunit
VAVEKRGAVYLRQMPLLFPHLSVGENVAFPLRVRGVSEGEVRARVARALEEVRLGDRADRRPGTLSGGEAQRVALARATVSRPALLLLDEPLSALDPSLRDEVRASIIRLAEAYRPGLVMVTHDLDEAGVLAHRIGVLVERRLEQVAPPSDLFRRPATPGVARFLGVPNFVHGEVTEDGVFRGEGVAPLAADTPAGAAVAAFRAGALRAHPQGEITGTVVGHLHRSSGLVSQVRVAGMVLEWAPDPYSRPAIGDEVRLRLDPRGVVVYPCERTDSRSSE